MGTVARTAVIAGTATAVSGSMHQNAAAKQSQAADAAAFQQQQAAAQQQAMIDQAVAQQVAAQQETAAPPAAAPPAAAPAPAGDVIQQLKDLADLKNAGILTEEEFSVQKARILGS
jgi:hypothetical protein